MNYSTQLFIFFFSGIFLSCQSGADKTVIIHQDAPLKAAIIRAANDKGRTSLQVFVSDTHVTFEQSHFQSTNNTITITKRRHTATIYVIRRNGSFVRLLDAPPNMPVTFSNTWIGSYDDANNILFVISPVNGWYLMPLKTISPGETCHTPEWNKYGSKSYIPQITS